MLGLEGGGDVVAEISGWLEQQGALEVQVRSQGVLGRISVGLENSLEGENSGRISLGDWLFVSVQLLVEAHKLVISSYVLLEEELCIDG